MVSRLLDGWKRVEFPAWTAPLALLLAAILCYALRLPRLGFYWDDWPYLYLFKVGGYPALYTSLGVDRPMLSWLYAATLTVLGYNPLAWQIFALVMRWLLGVAFWFALRQAWPTERGGPLAAALLFTVYPGFTQQWISVVWGNAFVLYAALFLSLGLTAWAARRSTPRALWLTLLPGLALSAFTLFSTEYFFGLELLRPLLVWLALSTFQLTRKQRALQTGLAWLPYLVLMIAFVLWRAFFQPSAHGGLFLLRDLGVEPLPTLAKLLVRIFQDAVLAFSAAWGQALDLTPILAEFGSGFTLQVALFALGVTGLFWLILSRVPAGENGTGQPAGRRSWAAESLLLGGLAFLAAGWPVWVARLPLRMGFPWDRYTLSLSVGAALAAAGLFTWLARSRVTRALLLALLIGASAGFHNANAESYRRDWNAARDLLWQLAWRAPAIQPGTALLADGTGLLYAEDDSLSGPLNWMYASGADPTSLAVLLMNIPERAEHLGYLTPGAEIHKGYRSAAFSGSTGQAVVLLLQPPGCLQVLDPRLDGFRADLPDYARRALPLSRPELLLPAAPIPAAPPAEIFGPEPEHKWCYYYEKAALAAQQEDWESVNELKRQVLAAGHKPFAASEYLVYIRAALRTYAWDDAAELSRAALEKSSLVEPALCTAWKAAAAWGANSDIYRALSAQFVCTE